MVIRVLAFFLLLFSILFMPLWVSIILAFAGIVYFPLYLEAALLFLLSDVLFGVKNVETPATFFVSFISCLIAILVIEIVKKKLKFYPHT